MHIFINTFAGILLAAIAACGPAPQDSSSSLDSNTPDTAAVQAAKSREQPEPNSEQAEMSPQQDSTLTIGKKVYDSYCLACHQADGSGVPGMYPPLTDTAWLADEERLIQIIIEGLSGPITVHGKPYNQMMPTHNFLDDNEIAAVLNYIRKQYGNAEGNITPGRIKAQREQ